jgi:hypothetical protein
LRLSEDRLTGSEAGGGHPARGTGDVIEAELVTEPHGFWIPSMLTADPEMDVRIGPASLLHRDPHQAAHARLVDRHEGVFGHELALLVEREELPDIVARKAERGLRQVVGPEGKEVGVLRDLGAGERGPGELDHRTELDLEIDPRLLDDPPSDGLELFPHLPQLLGGRHERDHDLRPRIAAPLLETHRRLRDRARLHRVEPGFHDAQTHAS